MTGTRFQLAEGAHGDWLPSRVPHSLGAARQQCPDLRETAFADVVISEIVGQGRRCAAFAARRYGRDLVLKAYHPRSAARHAHRCGGSIARYEYERNAAFHSVPALAGFIAAQSVSCLRRRSTSFCRSACSASRSMCSCAPARRRVARSCSVKFE